MQDPISVRHNAVSAARQFGSTAPVNLLGTSLHSRPSVSSSKSLIDEMAWRSGIQRKLDLRAQPSGCFDTARSVDAALPWVEYDGPALFLICDLLHFIDDPRSLLRRLRQLLKTHQGHRALLSCAYPAAPSDADRPLRRWQAHEFAQFLTGAGFTLEDRQHQGDHTAFLISCSEASHQAFLQANGLPPLSPMLLLTTETVAHQHYGGIATYIRHLWDLLPEKPIIYTSFPLPPAVNKAGDMGAFIIDRARLFPDGVEQGDFYTEDNSVALWQEIQHLLFLYDTVRLIEMQDFIGDACRLAQARQAGLLSSDITLLCRGHGNHVYLEQAGRQWMEPGAERTMLQERLVIEKADHFLPASTYLAKLYRRAGIDLPMATEVLPLPFSISQEVPVTGDLDTLIFFGKPVRAKGFDLFTAAVERLAKLPVFQQCIRRIIIMGGIAEQESEFFQSLLPGVEITGAFLPHDQVRQRLRDYGGRAMVVMPYRDDNWPVSMLETIDAGCHPIAFARGGIPEIIPASAHALTLCEEGSETLAVLIASVLSTASGTRQAELKALQTSWRRAQEKTNSRIVDLYGAWLRRKPSPVTAKSHSFTVVIHLENSLSRFLADVVAGLNAQLTAPLEILFVIDPAQEKEVSEQLSYLQSRLRHPYRVLTAVDPTQSPRDQALAACRTPWAVFVNLADIPLPHFLSDLAAATECSGCDAVMGLQRQFIDGDHWRSAQTGPVQAPLGLAGLITQTQNTLGHVNIAVTLEAAREAGGWDKDAVPEEWDFLLRLVYAKHRIAIIPRVGCLQRVAGTAAVDVARSFAAQRRLQKASADLDLWTRRRLQPAMQNFIQRREQEIADLFPIPAMPELEGMLASIRSARGHSLPPRQNLWPTDETTRQANHWRERPAQRIRLPEDYRQGAEESLTLHVTLKDIPTVWSDLVQYGDTRDLFRIKFYIGPNGMLRLDIRSASFERPVLFRAFKVFSQDSLTRRIVVSLSSLSGCVLLWIDGKRVLSHCGEAWRMPQSDHLWLGSRNFHGSIDHLDLYRGFLVEGDMAELDG